MRPTRIVAATVGIALGAAACQLVAGLDGDFQQAAPTTDAGTGGATGCVSATYPDPPAGSDDGSGGDLVMAMRTLDLGEGATTPPGYDLDHTCTCFEDAGPTCASDKQHCDAPSGIDSASAQFFTLIKFAVGPNFSSDHYNQKIGEGQWSFVMRIRGYNGKADDPKVDVALFVSPGMDTPPAWNGADAWSISEQAVKNGDLEQPIYTSDGAYVANGTLVAALPSLVMVLGATADTITLQLTGGVVTGQLVKGPSGWGLTHGILAARWKIDDIFKALGSYRDGNSKPICTDVGFAYKTAKDAICSGLDILADPSGAKSLPCDALSIGIGFAAEAAQLGAVVPPPTPSPGCPAATDPAMDSCPH